ncbi:hypothetical protein KP004_19465 [Geomonas oryzisoli]|uniref:Addiction module antitoxin RelB n=1 Tax=Geomonas oryzisoli TaxID=2847992 RepID=A0ABX8J7L4_9BACT|nr:hypothetical protein [Geomonas oryzisoli]QWV93317.1 hypothetical protein KP004_19465 [Geomonas oryzisoli]
MDLSAQLAETARRQHDDAGLPAWLVEDILALCAAPGVCDVDEELIRRLLRQVEEFDSYAGVGCFGDSASAADIEATLTELRKRH